MTKDYAKKNHAKTRSGHSNSRYNDNASFLPPWAWLSIGIFIGVFLFALINWKILNYKTVDHVTDPYPAQASIDVPSVASSIEQAKNQASSTLLEPPVEDLSTQTTRFDFYTLLPNMNMEMEMKVPDPIQENKIAQKPKTPTAKPKAKPKMQAKIQSLPAPLVLPSNFIVQVASFRSYNQAESLKAKLALKGFESKIQSISMRNNNIWYRVYLGPFDDKGNAKSIQSKLESKQKMNSFVLKINV